MPIFEFRCNQCGEQFERLVRISDNDRIECKKCRSTDTTKLLSATSAYGRFKDLGTSCKSSPAGHG